MSETLENLLQETRRFEPPADLAAQANVKADTYEREAADRRAVEARLSGERIADITTGNVAAGYCGSSDGFGNRSHVRTSESAELLGAGGAKSIGPAGAEKVDAKSAQF